MKMIECLVEAVRDAAAYNPDVQVAPHCILWPDAERQWQGALPRLRRALPELLTLGDYAPAARTGPAIWLRCAIAGAVAGIEIDPRRPPILYLPGFSRQDLRAVDSCPDALKPLAELQYLGAIWSQLNAKDWTVFAFLKSEQGGLGLDVAQDGGSRAAMHLALARLLEEEVEELGAKHLNDAFFYKLIAGDPVRDLLRWLDEPETVKQGTDADGWRAFVALSKSEYGFDPEAQGALAGAARLAEHKGAWQTVWDRYREAPARYAQIPGRMRQCAMPAADLYASAETHGAWPQWNDGQEQLLDQELDALTQQPLHAARARLGELEARHGPRRALVWAELGEAPLAVCLQHLAALAETTSKTLAVGSVQELAAAYAAGGWRADDALLRALAAPLPASDLQTVHALARQLYEPWADAAARHLQQRVAHTGYPGGAIDDAPEPIYPKGQVVLFVDGLRFDLAQRLAARLRGRGLAVDERTYWAALPSVTPTAKPAVSPVRGQIRGQATNVDFEPGLATTGQPLTSARFKVLLSDAGWQISADSFFAQAPNGWFEIGEIDSAGHEHGWKLARHVDTLLGEVEERVAQLLAAGWTSVRVVADHGWLLLPGGLPKASLPATLTENMWGRCAAVKPGAITDVPLLPWYWNPQQTFGLAEGICCFMAGREYAHGGLSLQECVLDELHVGAGSHSGVATITGIAWKGLACRVTVTNTQPGLLVDLRTHAGDAASSVAHAVKAVSAAGAATVMVENDELIGRRATLVLLDAAGRLVAQQTTQIGGE